MAENAFRQSMLLSNGSLGIFFSNGLVGTISTVALVLLLWPLISSVYERVMMKTKPSAA
jgi:putative tricarboxylic transport membrane protein